MYVYNPTRMVVHKLVDGRSDERCNLDQIANRHTTDEEGLRALKAAGKVRLCRRCFPADEG